MHSISDIGAPAPCPAPFNMAAYVLSAAARTPDKEALVLISKTGAQRWSYADLAQAVGGVVTGLRNLGLKPGDKILMRLGNTVEFPIVFLAAIAGGFVPVPTSAMLTSAECDKIAKQISPTLIVYNVGIALPQDPLIHRIDTVKIAQMQHLDAAPFEYGDPERLAYMIYTSGTGGMARAVMHAHRAIWARRMMWQDWYGLRPTDRMLHAGAFNWTYTLGTGLMDPWTRGATAYILDQDITPTELAGVLAEYDISIFAAAPGVYRQMLKQDISVALPALRHGLSAGEKLPDRIRDAWLETTGTPIYEAFGMSECSTFISGSPTRQAPDGCSGYPQRGRRITVLSEDGQPVPIETTGELAISAKDQGLMLGYFNDRAATAAKIRDGWFMTGDMVSMAADGAITYEGRNDDMMNAGGFRVSPLEVERVLARHDHISEVAVVEVTIKADTTVIAAFYTGPAEIDAGELHLFVAPQLARYKSPRVYNYVAKLPKGANNKILRRALRHQYEALHGQT